jgi:hypothetical protein
MEEPLMPIGQMRQIVSGDQTIQQLQDALNDQFNQLALIPFINGRLIEGQTLSAGANTINHKLGRAIKGYFLTSCSSPTTISNGPLGDTSNFVINSSGATTASIWVF